MIEGVNTMVMKRLWNLSFAYMVIALLSGVFYREYTRGIGYTEATNLSLLHTHLLVLGMVVFLVVLALEAIFHLSQRKFFKGFLLTYNIGLVWSAVMMAVRGWLQVRGGDLSKAVDASVSGIAGIGHILLGVGMILFFLNLKEAISAQA